MPLKPIAEHSETVRLSLRPYHRAIVARVMKEGGYTVQEAIRVIILRYEEERLVREQKQRRLPGTENL